MKNKVVETEVDLLDEFEYAPKKKEPKRKRNRPKKTTFLLAGVIFIILLAAILFSPLFAAKNIVCEGVDHFTNTEIARLIGFELGDNVILFDRGKAIRALEEEPYIAKAEISLRLPDTLVVSVTERKVRGYVPYMGTYLYIDEEGRVLETQDAYYDTLPEVKGLQFDSFKLGEVLPVSDEAGLLAVLQMSQLMKKYELLDIVVEIDVSNPKDVYAYVNKVSIHLGSLDDGDQKIRIMAEIMKTIAPEDRGTLDLSDLSKPIVFQYLT